MAETATSEAGRATEQATETEAVVELRAVFAELAAHNEQAEERLARGGDYEAQLALVWSRRELDILANRFESAIFDVQAGEQLAWELLGEATGDRERDVARAREEGRSEALARRKKLGDAALDAYRAYRRSPSHSRRYGETALFYGEGWRVTDARERMFAAFDALEKGER